MMPEMSADPGDWQAGMCLCVQGRTHISGEGAGAGPEGEAGSCSAVSGRRRPIERSGGGLASCRLGWRTHRSHGNHGSTQPQCSHEGWRVGHFACNYQVLCMTSHPNPDYVCYLCICDLLFDLSPSSPQCCNHAGPDTGLCTDDETGGGAHSFLRGSHRPGGCKSRRTLCRWVWPTPGQMLPHSISDGKRWAMKLISGIFSSCRWWEGPGGASLRCRAGSCVQWHHQEAAGWGQAGTAPRPRGHCGVRRQQHQHGAVVEAEKTAWCYLARPTTSGLCDLYFCPPSVGLSP